MAENMKPEKKNKGMGYYATGVAVTAALVGSLFARQACQSEGVQPVRLAAPVAAAPAEKPSCPPPRECPDCPACEPPASKTDEKCEPEKGEADLRSPNYDAKNCGYCGDGMAQQHEYPSWNVPDPLEPWMVECDVDFHCGNGKVDRRNTYATLVPVMQSENEVVGYKVEMTEVTESCRATDTTYCEADCPKQGGGHRPDTETVAVVQPVQQTAPLANCTGQDLSAVTGGNGWGTLVTRVQAAVDRARGRLREQLGYSSSSDTVTVTTKVRVSTSGVPSLYSVSATCIALNQESCPSSRDMLSIIGSVNFSNAQPGSPSVECLVPVPKPLRP